MLSKSPCYQSTSFFSFNWTHSMTKLEITMFHMYFLNFFMFYLLCFRAVMLLNKQNQLSYRDNPNELAFFSLVLSHYFLITYIWWVQYLLLLFSSVDSKFTKYFALCLCLSYVYITKFLSIVNYHIHWRVM